MTATNLFLFLKNTFWDIMQLFLGTLCHAKIVPDDQVLVDKSYIHDNHILGSSNKLTACHKTWLKITFFYYRRINLLTISSFSKQLAPNDHYPFFSLPPLSLSLSFALSIPSIFSDLVALRSLSLSSFFLPSMIGCFFSSGGGVFSSFHFGKTCKRSFHISLIWPHLH